MLDNLPHDQAFSQLIITQMQTYADKCNGWYKALVSRTQPTEGGRRVKAPAAFAESEALREVITSLLEAESDKLPDLCDKEVSLLITEVEKDPLDQADLIYDRKSITGLCMLYTSMKWLATKVSQLRYISDRATDSSRPEPGTTHARHNRRWTLLASTEPRSEGGLPVYLPLNPETASTFDAVLQSYRHLASTVLKTLHFSIRTHILFSLSSTISQTYVLETVLNEPTPAMLELNTSLIAYDTHITTSLPQTQHAFLTRGLAPLMDTYLLLLCSSRITSLNPAGAKLLQLNILVLQQNLRNISTEARAELSSSALFFDLFLAGPEEVVKRAKKEGRGFGVQGQAQREVFGYEAVKRLVELCYGERLNSERRDVGVGAKRQLDSDLLEISEAMY
jgi:exocyst complex component 4